MLKIDALRIAFEIFVLFFAALPRRPGVFFHGAPFCCADSLFLQEDTSPTVPLSFEIRYLCRGQKQVSGCSLFSSLPFFFLDLVKLPLVVLMESVHTRAHTHTHACTHTQNGVWLFLNYLNSLWKRGPFVGFLWDCPWKAPIVWQALWYNASAFNRFNGTCGHGSQAPRVMRSSLVFWDDPQNHILKKWNDMLMLCHSGR